MYGRKLVLNLSTMLTFQRLTADDEAFIQCKPATVKMNLIKTKQMQCHYTTMSLLVLCRELAPLYLEFDQLPFAGSNCNFLKINKSEHKTCKNTTQEH